MDEEIAEIVRQHGWYAANVYDADPRFVYTIGLMETCRHPEFIVFGREPSDVNALLSELIRDIRTGQSFAERGVYNIQLGGDEHRIGIRTVHPTQHELFLGFAMGYLTNIGRIGELQAVQLFWPDRKGKFPFEANCELGVYNLQPHLDIALSPREVRNFKRQFE